MFNFLFKNKKVDKYEIINQQYMKIKDLYSKEPLSTKRKNELQNLIEKYGYLPYSQIKALEELTPAEVIFCLEKKMEINNTYKDNKFTFKSSEISPVKRLGFTDADWIKKEQHEIKLINLAALGNGLKDPSPAKFIDWLRQIVILPSGNISKNILSTTIYLVPFHPRDFGNAYLTASAEDGQTCLYAIE